MNSAQEVFVSAHTRCLLAKDVVLVLALEAPRPRISTDVLCAIERALDHAEQRSAGLVIGSSSLNFAFGADLDAPLAAAARGETQILDDALRDYQKVMLRVRDSRIPVVAAVHGVAVSGGCELLMHCDRVVAHTSSRIGLAEPSAGVVPAGGGLKELMRRAAESDDLTGHVKKAFEMVSASKISHGAFDAQHSGFLDKLDRIVTAGPLEAAIALTSELARNYAPPTASYSFRIAGSSLLQELLVRQQSKLDQGLLTPHQFEINNRLAQILCGVGSSSMTITESMVLELERRHFLALVQTPLTLQRIAHLRRTGRPLEN